MINALSLANRWWLLFAVVASALAFAALAPGMISADAEDAQGRNVTGGKTLAPGDISCGGSTTVTLTLDAASGIAGNPADIALVLDRSGSMAGAPLADLKTAANAFVDIIDEATDGALDGTIANGSRIGVVSFAGGASTDQGLTGSGGAVKAAINALSASGATNHEAAFQAAAALLAGGSSNDIVVIMTDGQTTAGGDPDNDAAALRSGGAVIYAIGLGSVDVGQLRDWATDPDSDHVFITPSSSDLQAIFEAIGAAIVVPAATGVSVVDTVNSHFSVSGESASKGNVAVAGNTLTWTIDELGTETVTLTYTATHDSGQAGGAEQVNDSVTYADDAGHTVTFPSPTVNVRGCAATIDLVPETAVNELGTPGQTHTVIATVKDDFGDPVADVAVDFEIISGPNASTTGNGVTDAAGEASFTYEATQGLAGLGDDVIQATAAAQVNVHTDLTDTAEKKWADTTPPTVSCQETNNPSGGNVPSAPGNGGQGQNQDGFYVLTATDAVDHDPELFLKDTGTGTVFGPFASGTKIKYVEANGAKPGQKPGSGDIDWKINGQGDAAVYAMDASGNVSDPVSCLVPPKPQ